METHSLVCHPDTPSKSVQSVDVRIARSQTGQLMATYVAISRAGTILIPARLADGPSRVDDLWKMTCFEAFVRHDQGAGYYEFNFAPSMGWAAYGFADRRTGMANAPVDPPIIEVTGDAYRLEMTVAVDPGRMPGLSRRQPWRLALTAVIEEADGTRSYWALAHPAGEPDFHDPACFTALLAAPDDI